MRTTIEKAHYICNRKEGQLVTCRILECEHCIDYQCYCQNIEMVRFHGICFPVCKSYVGPLLDDDDD